jgi:ABC-type lipoprotein export system ATPase subunit
MVTHEPDIASFARRKVTVRDGLIIADSPIQERNSASEALAEWNANHERFLAGTEEAR